MLAETRISIISPLTLLAAYLSAAAAAAVAAGFVVVLFVVVYDHVYQRLIDQPFRTAET